MGETSAIARVWRPATYGHGSGRRRNTMGAGPSHSGEVPDNRTAIRPIQRLKLTGVVSPRLPDAPARVFPDPRLRVGLICVGQKGTKGVGGQKVSGTDFG